MSKIIMNIIVYAILILISVNCGSKGGADLSPEPTRKVMKNIPDWYLNAPVKEGFRYEAAVATSQDLQLSVNKATVDAASRLAATIESEMEGYIKCVQKKTVLDGN